MSNRELSLSRARWQVLVDFDGTVAVDYCARIQERIIADGKLATTLQNAKIAYHYTVADGQRASGKDTDPDIGPHIHIGANDARRTRVDRDVLRTNHRHAGSDLSACHS